MLTVDKKILEKLPKWVQKCEIYELSVYKEYGETNYMMLLKSFADDEIQDNVFFNANSLAELKWQLAAYRKDRRRYGYDY